MTQSATDSRFHLGFLQVAQLDPGFVGGLLVTNHMGRPLEFQCTTPVRPNRTQEILYGPTLQPFVFSELIGKTLCERLSIKPQLLVVGQAELLDLRLHVDAPVVCIVSSAAELNDLPEACRGRVGRQLVRLHAEFPDDAAALAKLANRLPADAELGEPLERVLDALQETIRIAAA